jgi:hypothetical protein
MSIIVVNLQDNRAVFRIFIALLRFSFDSPSYEGPQDFATALDSPCHWKLQSLAVSQTHVCGIPLFTQENTWKLIQMLFYLKLSLYKVCTVLGYYTVYSGNSLLTFWDNLLVPSARVKGSQDI